MSTQTLATRMQNIDCYFPVFFALDHNKTSIKLERDTLTVATLIGAVVVSAAVLGGALVALTGAL